eukprot:2869878-Rhodomonas_salina.1
MLTWCWPSPEAVIKSVPPVTRLEIPVRSVPTSYEMVPVTVATLSPAVMTVRRDLPFLQGTSQCCCPIVRIGLQTPPPEQSRSLQG